MCRNYFGWLVISLIVLIAGCSDSKTTSGVESGQAGTYQANFTAEQTASTKWTGVCYIDMVQLVGSWAYLYFKSGLGNCYFRFIRAKGDTGRLWAVIGSNALTNDDSGYIFIQHSGRSVKRIRLCYALNFYNCKGMPGTSY